MPAEVVHLRPASPSLGPGPAVGARLPDRVVHDRGGAPVPLRALQGPFVIEVAGALTRGGAGCDPARVALGAHAGLPHYVVVPSRAAATTAALAAHVTVLVDDGLGTVAAELGRAADVLYLVDRHGRVAWRSDAPRFMPLDDALAWLAAPRWSRARVLWGALGLALAAWGRERAATRTGTARASLGYGAAGTRT